MGKGQKEERWEDKGEEVAVGGGDGGP